MLILSLPLPCVSSCFISFLPLFLNNFLDLGTSNAGQTQNRCKRYLSSRTIVSQISSSLSQPYSQARRTVGAGVAKLVVIQTIINGGSRASCCSVQTTNRVSAFRSKRPNCSGPFMYGLHRCSRFSGFTHHEHADMETPAVYWPMVESSLGIVGACLPLLRPLFAGRTSNGFMRDLRSVIIPSFAQSTLSRNHLGDASTVVEDQPNHSFVKLGSSGTLHPYEMEFNS